MTQRSGIARLRLLIAVLATLALVATACGSDDSDGDAADEQSVDEQTAEEEPADEEPAAAEDGDADADDSEEQATEPVEAVIGIVNIAPVAALELVHEGFTSGMDECVGVNATIDYRNAEGDGAQLGPIVTAFLDDDVDMILAISTPALQATVGANEADGRGTPVLFGAVTNPFAAGAAAGPDDKPDWLTGWQADAPVGGMFDIAEAVNPDLATIGIAYDPSQVNAELAVEKMQAEADARGYMIETAVIGDSSEVGTAANSLAGRGVDVFFVPTDSILVNGLAGMVQVADDFDIPMIAQDSNIARAGAAIGTGLDYLGDGQRNADYACEILQGNATPADYPIQQFPEELVAYSSSAAAAQGFEVPEAVAAGAEDFG
ncbi:MAG: hypothetical protein GY939_26925 [Actinomycetia bacterium]|nr:hypothetical protein [Actinomycetes bacterium]